MEVHLTMTLSIILCRTTAAFHNVVITARGPDAARSPKFHRVRTEKLTLGTWPTTLQFPKLSETAKLLSGRQHILFPYLEFKKE
eukprot:15715016-Heterocapsa_arctica.AAC.1